jgi:hypothetical protein
MYGVLKLQENEFKMDVIPYHGDGRTGTLKIEE